MEQDEREMLMDVRDAVIEITQSLKELIEWLKLRGGVLGEEGRGILIPLRDINDTKE